MLSVFSSTVKEYGVKEYGTLWVVRTIASYYSVYGTIVVSHGFAWVLDAIDDSVHESK